MQKISDDIFITAPFQDLRSSSGLIAFGGPSALREMKAAGGELRETEWIVGFRM
jgi:hypothetical protein